MVLPLFAFVNAGVYLGDISLEEMISPVPLGIMLGLLIGKQLGVFGFSWLAIKAGIAELPEGSNWQQLYGVSILTGIGFTMSLFVDSLAYNDTQIYHSADKLAILLGSFLAGIAGYLVLKYSKQVSEYGPGRKSLRHISILMVSRVLSGKDFEFNYQLSEFI